MHLRLTEQRKTKFTLQYLEAEDPFVDWMMSMFNKAEKHWQIEVFYFKSHVDLSTSNIITLHASSWQLDTHTNQEGAFKRTSNGQNYTGRICWWMRLSFIWGYPILNYSFKSFSSCLLNQQHLWHSVPPTIINFDSSLIEKGLHETQMEPIFSGKAVKSFESRNVWGW